MTVPRSTPDPRSGAKGTANELPADALARIALIVQAARRRAAETAVTR